MTVDALPRSDPQRLHETVYGFCPLHHPERGICWSGCLPERVAFQAAAHALDQYWFDRKHGMPRWSERKRKAA